MNRQKLDSQNNQNTQDKNQLDEKEQLGGDFDESLTQKVVEQLLKQKDKQSNAPLIEKISINYIMNTIEKEHFSKLESAFFNYGKKGVGILEFIKIFLELNRFKTEENIYYLMALVDLYQQIQQNMKEERSIQFSDFTDFYYEFFQEKQQISEYKVQTYLMPPQKIIDSNFQNQREIDIDPPVIVGQNEQDFLRLNIETLRFDSLKHRSDNNIKGYYAEDLDQMITLDSLSGLLNMYNTNAQITHQLKPANYSVELTTVIVSFAYSNSEQRIGASLKDCTLVFWEKGDNFKFQKQFSTVPYIEDYSTDIWHLEQSKMWITTNRLNQIYIWNLIDEKLSETIQTNTFIKGNIVQVMEITHVKLIAIASADKQITFWNFYNKQMMLCLPVKDSGIHNLSYSYHHQMIITAGYEQIIYLYSIDPVNIEYKQEGRLIGHGSMVTALQQIKNTEMIVSADDQGVLKIWDIRSFGCLQTIQLFIKSTINQIQYMPQKQVLCLLSSRVGFINFDIKSNLEGKKTIEKTSQEWPINVDFDMKNQQIVVCTSKDVRTYDGMTGRMKKLIKGISREQTEITNFCFVNQSNHFIITDDKGSSHLFEYPNTQNKIKLHSHQSDITQMRIDFKNKLIITVAKDSQIIIQKINKTGQNELKRVFKNAHYGKGINLLEFSYYHNMIFTGSDSNEIFIYDYEYLKCIGTVILPNNQTPTQIHLINGFSILSVSTTDSFIYLIHIQSNENYNLKFKLLQIIDLQYPQRNTCEYLSQYFNSNLISNIRTPSENQNHNQSQLTLSYKLSSNKLSQSISKSPTMINYQHIDISKSNSSIVKQNQKNQQDIQDQTSYPIKLITNNSKENKLCLYVGLNIGQIDLYDISQVIEKNNITIKPSYENSKKNFNPFRNITEEFKVFSEKAEQNRFSMQNTLTQKDKQWQDILDSTSNQTVKIKSQHVHKVSLNSMKIISLNRQNYIVTCSNDGYFKIFDLNLNEQTNTNVNHPLPMNWNLKLSILSEQQRRFFFTVKILELMCKKFDSDKVFSRLNSTKQYLQQVLQTSIQTIQNQESIMLTQPPINLNPKSKQASRKNSQSMDLNILINEENTKQFSKVMTMKNFYTPKDMQFNKIKDQIQTQIRGPSLKEMEVIKRIKELKNKGEEMEQQLQDKDENNDMEVEKKMREQEDRENVVFLLPQYRQKLLKKSDEFQDASEFQKKLEIKQYYLDKQRQQQMNQINKLQHGKTSNEEQTTQITQNLQMNRQKSSLKDISTNLDVRNTSQTIIQNNININQSQNESFNNMSTTNNLNSTKMQNIQNSYYHQSVKKPIQFKNFSSQIQLLSLPSINQSNLANQTQTNQKQIQTNQQLNQSVYPSNQSTQAFGLSNYPSQQMLFSNNFQKQQPNQSILQSQSKIATQQDINKRGSTNSSPRVQSDFFNYAQQKNLYQEGSSRYQNQLNELSQILTNKNSITGDISLSLRDENCLQQTTQINQMQACKINSQKNKVQLLKRMEERNKLNDIIKNLNQKLVNSKHYSQNKVKSQNILPQTTNNQQSIKNTNQASQQKIEFLSFFQLPSPNNSEIATQKNIESYKINNNFNTNTNRQNITKSIRARQLQSLSYNPSQVASINNLSQI
ncbi:WD40 domain protein, putative (macronuclear) [Tetrahymena thermophila SB210]|uniref:WD40 domain protein, putative n=1 Tax=Tetrahymena thermophila (strain SB210) TaxID=312017 RepID=Q247V6_TETTS|nr:WD40 domain protein, putative [Tetrahymena thermophila SB210]EAS04189.2 WD40 domain protein, putative [Tetrahymena thermophila SB210]|eukprot:XP_001024434.2 WD40 domain protein, putative [Tetrahymena thermophila SB210]